MNLLKGKTVIVTGASRGIGKRIALTLAKNGANIAFTYSKSIEAADKLLKEISNFGVKCKSYQSNAAKFEESKSLIENILNDFNSFDVLINNAGITKDNLLMRMSEEDFDKVIEVNLKSVFNMVKACQSVFLKQKSGSIINISSIVGLKGNAGQSNYAASKAGIVGFSKSIALELGSRNIRSNVVAPGFIETEMTSELNEDVLNKWIEGIPLKRGGKPEDVANLCLFLSSDLSSFITGQVINVDGGMLT
ncbi:MAG: 3-oxoacyl-[acyl-carrier-protein] reductase [Flavobacteriaceae bacterium]|nr:3-oxoacyl-[acyl-carrier-protein] reductase [Flavobacteriaceae bacterium]|tara:strand:+ start:4062 stop:4808 length:747 start_codon:yes stop_codon:yes gene_type:complete